MRLAWLELQALTFDIINLCIASGLVISICSVAKSIRQLCPVCGEIVGAS